MADETRCRLQLSNQQLQYGCLPGSVGADDADARVELDVEVDVAEEGFGGLVAEGDAAHLDDGRGELFDVWEAEVHGVDIFRGFEDGHLFELLDAGLGFRRFSGVVAEFVDEGLEVGALDHLVVVFAFCGFAAFFFGGVEGVCEWSVMYNESEEERLKTMWTPLESVHTKIGALVVVQALRMLVDDICCDLIEESSVMGNDKHGTRIRLEIGR